MDERREDRRKIKLGGHCRDNRGRRSIAEISELSIHGCKVRTSPILYSAGGTLWIKLGQRDFMQATIKWHRRDTAGLSWINPLHSAILDHIHAWYAADAGCPDLVPESPAGAIPPLRRAC